MGAPEAAARVGSRARFVAPEGFGLFPGHLSAREQSALVDEVISALRDAPPYRPITPGGKAMSVRMSNLGPLGWVTDDKGYRYSPRHPITNEPWPPIPRRLLDLWARVAPDAPAPDACLVNLYDADARMGLHRDQDEADFGAPVVSVSLGDTAMFRLGGLKRTDATASLRLASGDVCVLGGAARLAFHGVDRILPSSSRLVPGGGRINLTLRRAGPV